MYIGPQAVKQTNPLLVLVFSRATLQLQNNGTLILKVKEKLPITVRNGQHRKKKHLFFSFTINIKFFSFSKSVYRIYLMYPKPRNVYILNFSNQTEIIGLWACSLGSFRHNLCILIGLGVVVVLNTFTLLTLTQRKTTAGYVYAGWMYTFYTYIFHIVHKKQTSALDNMK